MLFPHNIRKTAIAAHHPTQNPIIKNPTRPRIIANTSNAIFLVNFIIPYPVLDKLHQKVFAQDFYAPGLQPY